MVEGTTTQNRSDVEDVLRAIRSVAGNLENRAARAQALEEVIWAAVIVTTFLFYQLVWWNPLLYWNLLGPFVALAWMVPVSAGWLAHEILASQATLAADHDSTFRGDAVGKAVFVLSIVLIGPVIAVIQFLGAYGRIPGAILVFVAVMKATERTPEHGSPPARILGTLMVAATGLFLVVFSLNAAFILAAVAYMAGIGAFAVLDYRRRH